MEFVPGKYVIGVSGGIDSVVLLQMMAAAPGVQLTVAHFDHGMRAGSAEDRHFAEELAAQLKLPFVYAEGRLGPAASEARARQQRYQFLRKVKANIGADRIVTAHHQDDLLETAILNLLRGTGYRGLASLGSDSEIYRPLLGTPRSEIKSFADEHRLQWREDPTNRDRRYLRNYVRHEIMPRLGTDGRASLLTVIEKAQRQRQEIEPLLIKLLQNIERGGMIDRQTFARLPYDVSKAVMMQWLRQHDAGGFARYNIDWLTVAAKTAKPGRRIDAGQNLQMHIAANRLALRRLER